MSFPARFALVVVAAFFLSSVGAALLCLAVSRSVSVMKGLSRLSPGLLVAVRMLPAGMAIAVTALVWAPAYFRHEQRGELEQPGLLLMSLAAAGVWILVAALSRALRSTLTASRLRAAWAASAVPVDINAGIPAFSLDLPFPLVAVLGAIKPRLFISTAVLRTCSAPELAAIVQHERAHVSRRDNAVRLLMEAAPDLISRSAFTMQVVAEWHRSIEHRADDAAAVRLDLASALVRVARLASQAAPVALPASALYRGEGADTIEERVRRLAAVTTPRPAVVAWRAALVALLTILAFASMTAGARAHAVLEVLVSRLP